MSKFPSPVYMLAEVVYDVGGLFGDFVESTEIDPGEGYYSNLEEAQAAAKRLTEESKPYARKGERVEWEAVLVESAEQVQYETELEAARWR